MDLFIERYEGVGLHLERRQKQRLDPADADAMLGPRPVRGMSDIAESVYLRTGKLAPRETRRGVSGRRVARGMGALGVSSPAQMSTAQILFSGCWE